MSLPTITGFPMERDAVYIDAYKADPKPLFIHGSDKHIAFDMELQRDLRAAGTFRFSITDNHPHGGSLYLRNAEIAIKRFDDIYWMGYVNRRICSTPGVITYECIGVLDYLNDSIQMPVKLTGVDEVKAFEYLLARHNEQMQGCAHKKIILDSGYGGRTIDMVIDKPTPTLEVIRKYFDYGVYEFDRYDGALYLSHRDGWSIASKDQGVQYGSNLISLEEITSGSGIITRLIPLGKKGDELVTIESVNNGVPFIDADTVTVYTPVVGTVTFDDISDPAQLLIAARNYMHSLQTETTRTLRVEAIDKYVLDAASAPMPLGGVVLLESAPHGIGNDQIECTSVIESIGRPESGRFRFGDI